MISVVGVGAIWTEARTGYFPRNHIIHVLKPYNETRIFAIVNDMYLKNRFICSACSLKTDSGPYPVCGDFLLVLPWRKEESSDDDSSFFLKESGIKSALAYGDFIFVSGKVEPIPPQSNYYVYNPQIRLIQKRVHIQVKLETADTLHILATRKGNPIFSKFIIPIRERIVEACESNLSGLYAGLLKGIILGEKRDIPYDVRLCFSKAGISHILAVSGLHMGIIVGVIFILFSVLFRGNYRLAVAPAIGISFLFTLIVGFQPSTVRAFIMSSFFLFALFRGRSSNSFHTLGIAGFTILGVNPSELFNPGFQLSFGAVWGILVINPLISRLFSKIFAHSGEKTRKIAQPFWSLFSVSSSAQFGTSALVAMIFYRIQLVGPIVNMVVVPAVSLALPSGILSVATFYIFKPLSKILAASTWFFLHIIIKTAEFASNISWSAPFIKVPSTATSFGYYLFLTFLADALSKTKTSNLSKKLLLLPLIFFLLNQYHFSIMPREMELIIFDSYRGSAFLISKGNENLLLSNLPSDEYRRIILPYLNSLGREKPKRYIELASPFTGDDTLLTICDTEIKINKYGFVKMSYGDYEISLSPEKENRYLLRLERGRGNRFVFELYPRGVYKKGYGNVVDIRYSGAVRLKLNPGKLVIESKRLGKLGEWRFENAKRIQT